MKEQNNFYPIDGVVYAKPDYKRNGKKGTKNEGKVFEFHTIVLEVKREYKETVKTELIEFELGNGANVEEFSVTDKITVWFSLAGQYLKWKDKEGENKEGYINKIKAAYIKHSDMFDKKEVGGKVPSDFAKRETIFVPPSPMDDDAPEDDLPF